MSEACGISYDVLAWAMEWYIREETLREANTCIVNHHYGQRRDVRHDHHGVIGSIRVGQ